MGVGGTQAKMIDSKTLVHAEKRKQNIEAREVNKTMQNQDRNEQKM